jgi:signal transduction histidine kinase
VSHELRTPLTAIRGYAELIAAKPGDLRVADRARHIIDAADHVLALIGDILDAREIAAGQADLVFTDVDLAHELAQAAAMVRPQAAKAGVALVSAPVSGLPKVVADARRVRQVIVNLAGNAIKFTAAGGSVRLDAAYAADGGVVVTVSDTGRGMAPAEMETLLGAGASEQRPASRGIGLPLSRALAEANGARLSIESRSGLGTVARLSFPASSVVPP